MASRTMAVAGVLAVLVAVAMPIAPLALFAANRPPKAVTDSVHALADTTLEVYVLVNDRDPDGDPLTLVSATQPANGITGIRMVPVGYPPETRVTYWPNPGFTGRDSFTYVVSDGRGGIAVGKVTVTVK